MEKRNGCLVCGKEMTCIEGTKRVACVYCGDVHETDAVCVDGHFVCDRCFRLPAEGSIGKYCTTTTVLDPVAIARTLMKNPAVRMHGSEHHFLVPAALIAAYYNVQGKPELKSLKIGQAQLRAEMVKGSSCGLLGDCGAAVGTGIFVTLITGATPLSREEWKLSNLITAKSLEQIALRGGPRCCKRNTFLAIRSAADFTRDHFGIVMPITTPITCEFLKENNECLTKDCPFYPA
jgi:hypothetical protein